MLWAAVPQSAFPPGVGRHRRHPEINKISPRLRVCKRLKVLVCLRTHGKGRVSAGGGVIGGVVLSRGVIERVATGGGGTAAALRTGTGYAIGLQANQRVTVLGVTTSMAQGMCGVGADQHTKQSLSK